MMTTMRRAAAIVAHDGRPALRIRVARGRDAEELAVLMRRSLAEFEADFPESIWRALCAEWGQVGHRLDEAQVLVGHVDGCLASAIVLHRPIARSDGGLWPERWGAIRVLAVDPAFRRQGLGRALTEECLRRAPELGVEQVLAVTTPFMVAARGVLERCGFVRAPQFDNCWPAEGAGGREATTVLPALAYLGAV